MQEIGSGWNVWLRRDVRALPICLVSISSAFWPVTDFFHRICIVSLQRILWLRDWDLADMTFTVTEAAYWSVLEPTLGVVNACLPVMRPALRKLFHKDMFTWSKVYGTQSTARRQWFQGRTRPSRDKDGLEENRFHRLNNPEYLLTDLAVGQKLSPSSSDIIRVSAADAAQDKFDKAFSGNSIKVTRSWNVHTATGNGDQA